MSQNLDIIRRYRVQYLVILAGDHIYKMDYSRLLIDHVEKGAPCTVACLPVPRAEARDFDVLAVDANYRVVDFVEKPADPPEMPDQPDMALASMDIHVFDADYLYQWLEEDRRDDRSSHDFGKDILPRVTANGDACAHPFTLSCVRSAQPGQSTPYWRDVGTLDAYWCANLDLASVMPELNIYDREWPIRTAMPPAKFTQDRAGHFGVTLNSLVSGGCILFGTPLKH